MVNEQNYTATLRDNVITDPSATLGDIHNQLYLMFHSSLEEIHNVYTSQDLVRVYITHEESVNTNIIVGPDYLGNINADIIMNQIADVVHSNNFIPTNGGLIINIAAICNIKGLRLKTIINATKCQQRTPHQFIFYDFESILLNSGTHRPNLIVAQSICEHCSVHVPTCSTCGSQCALCDEWNDDGTHFDRPSCIDCSQREVVFRGEKTVEKFCSWLFHTNKGM